MRLLLLRLRESCMIECRKSLSLLSKRSQKKLSICLNASDELVFEEVVLSNGLLAKNRDRSGFAGEEGGGAGGMVGRIDQAGDLGKSFGENPDNAMVECLAGHRAPLAAARHFDIDDVLFQIDQLNVPAMLGETGVDNFVKDV